MTDVVAVSVRLDLVSPAIELHELPFASQRSHWYVNVIVAAPVHVPLCNERPPWVASPLITGSAVLTGGPEPPEPVTMLVAFESAPVSDRRRSRPSRAMRSR